MSDTQRIQIRLGQNAPEKLKVWADNQTNLNESVKKLIDHFVDLYGEKDVDSLDVKLKMARDLLSVQGKAPEPLMVPQKVAVHKDPEKEPEEKKKIINRGEIDI